MPHAAVNHQKGPKLTATVLLPQQTQDQHVLLLCPHILPGLT